MSAERLDEKPRCGTCHGRFPRHAPGCEAGARLPTDFDVAQLLESRNVAALAERVETLRRVVVGLVAGMMLLVLVMLALALTC